MKILIITLTLLMSFSASASEWDNNDKVVTSQHNAKERALSYCKRRDTTTLAIYEKENTISIVCKDDPNTLITFLL